MEKIVFFKKDSSSGLHRQLCGDSELSSTEIPGQLMMYKSHFIKAQRTVIQLSSNSMAQGNKLCRLTIKGKISIFM